MTITFHYKRWPFIRHYGKNKGCTHNSHGRFKLIKNMKASSFIDCKSSCTPTCWTHPLDNTSKRELKKWGCAVSPPSPFINMNMNILPNPPPPKMKSYTSNQRCSHPTIFLPTSTIHYFNPETAIFRFQLYQHINPQSPYFDLWIANQVCKILNFWSQFSILASKI